MRFVFGLFCVVLMSNILVRFCCARWLCTNVFRCTTPSCLFLSRSAGMETLMETFRWDALVCGPDRDGF